MYQPRQPAQGVLYQVVRDHFEIFRSQAADLRDGEGLPRFVEKEFRDFLRCGWLVESRFLDTGGRAGTFCADGTGVTL